MKNHHHPGKKTKNAFGQLVIKSHIFFKSTKIKFGKPLSLNTFLFFSPEAKTV